MSKSIALIGFGEAAATFADAARWAEQATAFDTDAARSDAMARLGVCAAPSARRALEGAPLILSLVTADQALAAARDYAACMKPGAIWCDMNSVAPERKRASARYIEEAGGYYVDAAILAPVDPARLDVPILLAGAAADRARESLLAHGFSNVRPIGEETGRASAIKMIRSVMVKGIEALTDEMMEAAQAAGVADEVLASLDASEKQESWTRRVAYNRERMATHGLRRAAEMEESARTLRSLGVEPILTEGTAKRQRDAAERTRRTGGTA
ncbi:DUF1932 domain-containing protein [Pelagerythrobacter marensis]|uniref:DUF1932 domain-containing protein n=1 Tax=Pelagerythrobacter marensis TaxID=543877 RepID=A0ABZ2D5N8_9SPHN